MVRVYLKTLFEKPSLLLKYNYFFLLQKLGEGNLIAETKLWAEN